eukprot:COSAG02_NODE_777_length_17301_cov_8.632310_18_plen_63_part_00
MHLATVTLHLLPYHFAAGKVALQGFSIECCCCRMGSEVVEVAIGVSAVIVMFVAMGVLLYVS